MIQREIDRQRQRERERKREVGGVKEIIKIRSTNNYVSKTNVGMKRYVKSS